MGGWIDIHSGTKKWKQVSRDFPVVLLLMWYLVFFCFILLHFGVFRSTLFHFTLHYFPYLFTLFNAILFYFILSYFVSFH